MKKTRTMLTVLGAAAFMMCCALVAQGQNNRTFVSGTGSDGNTGAGCLQTGPCRTFQAAIGVTNAGGQVIALDSTGYSAFLVNKALTIQGAPGVIAFIFVGTGGIGITVSGAASDLIILDNIFVTSAPGNTSTTGLSHTSGKLLVRNCKFDGLTTGVATSAKMDLVDSDVSGNTIGAQATGDGADVSCASSLTAGQTSLRIVRGNFAQNVTALTMVNPGVGASNCSNKVNIFLFAPGDSIGFNVSHVLTNFSGNTTFTSGSGTGCTSPGPCNAAATYQSTSGSQPK